MSTTDTITEIENHSDGDHKIHFSATYRSIIPAKIIIEVEIQYSIG